jgi:hypothetical protein
MYAVPVIERLPKSCGIVNVIVSLFDDNDTELK